MEPIICDGYILWNGQKWWKEEALVANLRAEDRAENRARGILGQQKARLAGKRIGRPPVVIDLQTAQNLRLQGFTIRQIAKTLKVGHSSIHRALSKAS